ncbi:cation:dicarboxylate symporter family transporter, partial [Acinetobacter baumannii]|uniref:cation:dicarboxylate symporter family transporter n=1 Tax=Acinetobacter baumannii TaxID=470 RepID=UPI0010596416
SIALFLGIIVAYVFKPGVGMNIDITHLVSKDLSTYTERAHDMHTGSEFLLIIIPKTFTAAFANGDILHVLLIAILFGVSLLLIPKHFAEFV